MHILSQNVLQAATGMFGSDDRGNHMFDYYLCLEAANTVALNVSTPRYIYAQNSNKELLKKEDSSEFNPLSRTTGLCGNHVNAMYSLMTELDYLCRDVQLYYHNETTNCVESHVFVEVYFGNKWRMLDVTWGWHPYIENVEQVIGYEEVMVKDYKINRNGFNPWAISAERNSPGFTTAHLTSHIYATTVAGTGSAEIKYLDDASFSGIINGLPKYLGHASSRMKNETRGDYFVTFDMSLAKGKQLRLNFSEQMIKEAKRHKSLLSVNGNTMELRPEIDLKCTDEPITIRAIREDGKNTYVTIENMSVT